MKSCRKCSKIKKKSIFAELAIFGENRRFLTVFLNFEHFAPNFIKNGCHSLESPAQGACAQPKKIEIGPKLDPLGHFFGQQAVQNVQGHEAEKCQNDDFSDLLF